MTFTTGANPPLHSRFNERDAMRFVRNRYRNCYEKIRKQVGELQKDIEFRRRCQGYYNEGYRDWVILVAVLNCMMNWRGRELGLDISRTSDQKRFVELTEQLQETVYPPERFMGEDMELHIRTHAGNALPTYGFQLRRRDINPMVVEKFMRERMRYFDFDLPHKSLFGEPPGDWPEF